jgi:hypothetical protein
LEYERGKQMKNIGTIKQEYEKELIKIKNDYEMFKMIVKEELRISEEVISVYSGKEHKMIEEIAKLKQIITIPRLHT